MNINTIFARVTSHFNTQMDAHLRAVAEGKQTATEAPTDRGVVLYATAGTQDYTIRSYRIPGQSECSLPTTEQVRVKPRDLDLAAAAYGYGLEEPPQRGYIHKLKYVPVGNIAAATNRSAAARAANMNSRQAAAMTASTTTGSAPNPSLLPPEQRIKVISVAGMPATSPGIWYCGRQWAGWKVGVLGNRHHINKTTTREEAVEHFATDLFADIQRQGPMYWELRAMQRKLEAGESVTLGCWCAPKVCHCDTIRKAVLRLMAGQPAATMPKAPPKGPYKRSADAARSVDPQAIFVEQFNDGDEKWKCTNGEIVIQYRYPETQEEWRAEPAPTYVGWYIVSNTAASPNPARAAAAAASATQAMAEPSAE